MSQVDCALCGHGFDPEAALACGSCPLRHGCPLVCCPACGHIDVDARQSRLVRLVTPLVHGRRARRRRPPGETTLADIAPERSVIVLGFGAGIRAALREHFRAYGLVTGSTVRVVQQQPVTVIRIDHTELALERELATCVLVDTRAAGRPPSPSATAAPRVGPAGAHSDDAGEQSEPGDR